MSKKTIPALGFVAPSGSGKTTLLRELVPILRERGLRVGYLKHAHHSFDLDVPGKDSYEVRAAGADQTLLASDERWALQVENRIKGSDPDLWRDAGALRRGRAWIWSWWRASSTPPTPRSRSTAPRSGGRRSTRKTQTSSPWPAIWT